MRGLRLKRLRSRFEKGEDSEEVNITSLIDIFTMLLFFLLTAASFSKTAILELNLPVENESPAPTTMVSPSLNENSSLTLAVFKNGFSLKDMNGKNLFIPLLNQDYNYAILSAELKKIKESFPQQKSIILLIEPEIIYDVIIKTMDHCRESKFPEISLADAMVEIK